MSNICSERFIRFITGQRANFDDLTEADARTVRAAQLDAVIELSPLTMSINVLNAAIIVFVLWNNEHNLFLASWGGATVLVALFGLRTWIRSRQVKRNGASPRAVRRFTLHAFVLSFIWGAMPVVLFNVLPPTQQFIIASVVTGMIAGGAFCLSTIPTAGLVYTWTLSLMSATALLLTGTEVYVAASGLLVLYAWFISRNLIVHGNMFMAHLRDTIELRNRGEVIGLLLKDFQEHASDWLWETDQNGVITRGLARFADAVATTATALEGAPLRDVLERMAVADSTVHEDVAFAMERRLRFHDLEVVVHAGDECLFWSLTGKPVFDAAGEFVGYRGVAADITMRRRAEQERERALEETFTLREQERVATASSQAKSAFLATMSHEIRTPMNAVIGLSSALLSANMNDEQHHLVATIYESSNSLLRLLDDVLDLSKLESGRIDFEAMPFSMAALMDNTASIVDARVRAKGLALRTLVGPLPPALVGDQIRIRQVLLNLITNAIKFTDTGFIEVAVRCLESDGGSATIECAVRDTGIGIAPDKLATIFEEFTQADASINRRFGGTGLGLAISKRLVEQMAGEIGVSSVPGKGTTFTFRVSLPLAATADLANLARHKDTSDCAVLIARLGRPLRILLAEDNETNQLVFRKLMEGCDAEITIACNGRSALEAASREAFDLVFMDMRMPEMDGLAAARAIRALGGDWARRPIIALTANAFADDVKACRDAGMSDFMAKPIRKNVLMDKLADLVPLLTAADCGVRSASVPAPQPAASAASDAPAPSGDAARSAEHAIPLVDRQVIDVLIEEIDLDGVQEMLAVFLKETATRLASLRVGAATLEHAQIRDEAHTLKGSAGTVGLGCLAALAAVLERSADSVAGEELLRLLVELETCFERSREALAKVLPEPVSKSAHEAAA